MWPKLCVDWRMLCLEASSVRIRGKRRQYTSGMANMRESSEQVEQTAAEWLARRQGGKWSPCDESALLVWLSTSTVNRIAYVRLSAAWEMFGVLAHFIRS